MKKSIWKYFKIASFFYILSIGCIEAYAANKIIAVVNDEIITQNQLNQVIQAAQQQYKATGKQVPYAQIKKEAIEQLIGNKLQLQVAKRNKITVSDADVNAAMSRLAKQNNLTLSRFKEELKKQGINYSKYKNFIRDQLILENLQIQALRPKIKVSEQDILNEMRQASNADAPVHLIDIVISPNTENQEDINQAKLVTKNIRRLLSSKKQNLEQAIAKSESSSISITQQDLGWKNPRELPDLFVHVVQKIRPGQVSQPIEAPNGFHLLKVVDRKGGTLTRKQAEQMAFHKKMMAEVKKWVAELKKNAYIEIKN